MKRNLGEAIISTSRAVIVIGGGIRTKEEVLLAEQNKLPVVPIGMTGGVAYQIWYRMKGLDFWRFNEDFTQLNSVNPFVAAKATTSILKSLL